MKLIYQISQQDYVCAVQLGSKLTRRSFLVYVVLALILLILAMANPFNLPRYVYFLPIAGALIGGFLGHYFFQPLMARRHYKKYKMIQEPFFIELIEECIHIVCKNSDGILTWDNILKWRQNQSYILVYFSPRLFYVIPKSFQNDGFDCVQLMDHLAQHLGKPV